MLVSELKIGEGYEVRDNRSLIGTVKMIVHKGRLKLALDFPQNITLRKTQEIGTVTILFGTRFALC
jgi:hypothetical protein